MLLGVVFFALVGVAVWFARQDPPPPVAPPPPMPAPSQAPPRPKTMFDLAAEGDLDGVKKLVEDRPERIAMCDESGWTPMHHAAYGGHEPLIKYLLDKGADPNTAAEGECVPIHMMATSGSPKGIKRLVEGGADVSQPDDTGTTALHFATLNNRQDLVEALIARGAPVNMKDASQDTPLDLARRMDKQELIDLLERAGGLPGKELTMKDVLAELPEKSAARRFVPRAWHLDVDDERFQASIEAAKAALPAFLDKLSTMDEPHAAVKFAVRGEGVLEYVWGVITDAGDPLTVEVEDMPTAVSLDGPTVQVPHDEVVDFQLKLDDDRTAGGYGQRATYEAIRDEYGFLPDDIEAELANLVDP